MMKTVGRILAWSGLVLVLGPGLSVPSGYDQIFQVFGLFAALLGVVCLLLGSKSVEER